MRKGEPLKRFILLGGVGVVALLVLTARWYLHFTNYTGLTVFPDLQVVRILADGPSIDSGIRVGDRIEAINERPVRNFTDYLSALREPELTAQRITVDVRRAEELLRFPLRVVSYPIFHGSMFGPGCGLLLLIFGLYVYFKRPEEPSSSLYLALNTCLFVLLTLSNHLLKQAPSPLFTVFWGLALILVVPVNLHFYLVFPEPKSLIRRRPWLLFGLYLVPLAFMVSLLLEALEIERALRHGLDSGPGFKRLSVLLVSYFFVGLLSCFAFVASLVHSLLKVDSPERKKQVQVVMIGAMTTFLLAIPVVYGLTFFVIDPDGSARWPPWAFSLLYGAAVLATVFLPLSMAVAVLRYRLWDVDTAINRSLIYMGVSIVLIALYFFIVGVLGWAFGRVVRPASHVALLTFTLTVAAVSEPLRHFVKRMVDRTFNREAYEYRKTLTDFSRELVSVHSLEDLTQSLCETISQALGVRNIVLLLKEQEERGMHRVVSSVGSQEHEAASLSDGGRIVEEFAKTHPAPFTPDDLLGSSGHTNDMNTWLESMTSARTNLVVPICKKEEFLGWISLGGKRSESFYTGEDRELLETLANQAAVAITNALAFEKVEALNRDLREKVAKVEEQRSEILHLQQRILGENRYLKDQIKGNYDFTEIVGAKYGLRDVMEMVKMAALSDATILIYGETGTGKELIARAIHFSSERKGGPFIKVNCAALSEGVLQSELFGHEKGAFTGAHEHHVGRFELAEGGTLFLDEIGDIPSPTQISLLRVLQEREFERVGGTQTIRTDVRIIAATNQNLEEAIEQGRFRTDLYYRLKVIQIEAPPLRERGEDLMDLALHFVDKYARKYGKQIQNIDEEVLERFRLYHWPGNVREMENVIERAVVLSRKQTLVLGNIPMELQVLEPSDGRDNGRDSDITREGPHKQIISEIERKRLLEALELAKGNKSQAARSLGLKRSTFFNKLRKYGLLVPNSGE